MEADGRHASPLFWEIQSPACNRCSLDPQKLGHCVTYEGLYSGACDNCALSEQGRHCSFFVDDEVPNGNQNGVVRPTKTPASQMRQEVTTGTITEFTPVQLHAAVTSCNHLTTGPLVPSTFLRPYTSETPRPVLLSSPTKENTLSQASPTHETARIHHGASYTAQTGSDGSDDVGGRSTAKRVKYNSGLGHSRDNSAMHGQSEVSTSGNEVMVEFTDRAQQVLLSDNMWAAKKRLTTVLVSGDELIGPYSQTRNKLLLRDLLRLDCGNEFLDLCSILFANRNTKYCLYRLNSMILRECCYPFQDRRPLLSVNSWYVRCVLRELEEEGNMLYRARLLSAKLMKWSHFEYYPSGLLSLEKLNEIPVHTFPVFPDDEPCAQIMDESLIDTTLSDLLAGPWFKSVNDEECREVTIANQEAEALPDRPTSAASESTVSMSTEGSIIDLQPPAIVDSSIATSTNTIAVTVPPENFKESKYDKLLKKAMAMTSNERTEKLALLYLRISVLHEADAKFNTLSHSPG